MAEESAVNYWEVRLSFPFASSTPPFPLLTRLKTIKQKYGHVAFDSSQKAVLTSCVLRYKPVLKSGTSSPVSGKAVAAGMCRFACRFPCTYLLYTCFCRRIRIRHCSGKEGGRAGADGGGVHQLLFLIHDSERQVGNSKHDRWELYPVLNV